MNEIVCVFIGRRTCYHKYLHIVLVCFVHDIVEFAHIFADSARDTFKGECMLALVEIDICRVAVFVLGDNGHPVCAVVKLYFTKGIRGNFAVDIKSSVGEKSA